MNFPFVIIGHPEDNSDILSVDNDNVQAAYDATRYLISLGHERIGFVSGPPNLTVSKDRMTGYCKAIAEADLPSRGDWIVEGEFLQESGYRLQSRKSPGTADQLIDVPSGIGKIHG